MVSRSHEPSSPSLEILTAPEASMVPRGACMSSLAQATRNWISLPTWAIRCVRPSMISTRSVHGQGAALTGGSMATTCDGCGAFIIWGAGVGLMSGTGNWLSPSGLGLGLLDGCCGALVGAKGLPAGGSGGTGGAATGV